MRAQPRRQRAVAAFGVLACLIGGLLTGCDGTPEVVVDIPTQAPVAFSDDLTQQFEDAVTFAMTAAGASGAIVGVWAPWSGEWTAALGTQDTGGGGAVDTDMTFRVSRLTRPMICDVLYALVDRGVVSLDDSPSTYVAGTAELADVTLGELCDSTSGVGAFWPQLLSMWIQNPERTWDPRELASYGLGKDRKTEPGSTFVDSDAGYVVLGLALERVTGKSADDLIAEYVTDPLGLTATELPTGTADAPTLTGHVSTRLEDKSFDCADPLDITDLSPSVGFTDSGVVADLADVRRYVTALAAGTLTPADVDRFAEAKPMSSKAPSWLTYAGGAVLAGPLVGQAGSIPGYSIAAFADGTTGLTVAVVFNNSASGAGIVQPLAWQLAAIASKAPAATGQTAPELGLPWTAEQYVEQITTSAICPLPEQ